MAANFRAVDLAAMRWHVSNNPHVENAIFDATWLNPFEWVVITLRIDVITTAKFPLDFPDFSYYSRDLRCLVS